jgi:two-component system CheB/CheR fusion protein
MQDVQSPRIEIASSLINDKTISIDVSDNGPGVSDEIRDKLFEPLTTTKAKGMGIGLSLSRSIAEIHSGGLSVTANAEGGATFSLTLPLIETE